jgi:gamma-glutamyltranspeptidase/glutathione hydrolase
VFAFDLNPDGTSKIKQWDVIKYPQIAVTMRKLVAAESATLEAGGSRHDALIAARDRFYKGDIAQEIADFSEKNGGLFRYSDFANYHTNIGEPVSVNYRGYNVYSNRNGSQGPTVLFWLNLLENFDLKAMKHNSLAFWHTMVETGKLAYADREWLSDVDYYPVPYKGLLSKEYAKDRAKLVDPAKANNEFRIGNPWPYQGTPTPPNPWGLTDSTKTASVKIASAADFVDDTDWAEVHGDTSGVSCADKWGNVIVMTPSLHSGWGTGVVMGNTGVIFNCRGDYYYLDPLHPNALKPGERPCSTLMTARLPTPRAARS